MHFKIQISGANTDRCNILCKTSFVCDKKRIIGSNEIKHRYFELSLMMSFVFFSWSSKLFRPLEDFPHLALR